MKRGSPKKQEAKARGRARRYTIKEKLEVLSRVRKEAVRAEGLSIPDVARIIGCSAQSIHNWLRDPRYSSGRHLAKPQSRRK
jgi:transposase